MRISRKQDYAVMLMGVLAKHHQKRLVPLSEIAQMYHLSTLFLRQIAAVLKKHQLITSKEGVGGGYQLARDPATISVADIIEAFEGSTALTICGAHAAGVRCDKESICRTQTTWALINQEVHQLLESKNLSQFI